MSPDDRSELEALQREQARLQQDAHELNRRIAVLARRMQSAPEVTAEPRPAPASQPPPLPMRDADLASGAADSRPPSVAQRPITFPPTPSALASAAPPAKPPPPPSPAAPSATKAGLPAESIELRLGTYWLARIGIVILLTGLVFLGNYAYQRYIPHLGPVGRLALLGIAGGLLAGLGVWLERAREATRNFGRVLLAGGAATFYYAAYAAHFVEKLRVIESPLAGGALLLGLTAAIVWFAERRKSEPTAMLAVLLAYYTSAINAIGGFTLFSNLLLTAAAVWLLVRQRWVLLTFASLAATYGSYGFWRFHSAVTTGASGTGEFGMALGFLAAYWALFTVAVFVADRAALPTIPRSAFLTLNNGAFFAFAAQHYAAHRAEDWWLFALVFGALILALSLLAARRHPDDATMEAAYLAQGLALVTAGLAAKLTGPQLAMTLAVESAVLINGAKWRHGWLYELAANLAAVAAFFLALHEISEQPGRAFRLGAPVAALLVFDAWWLKRLRGELSELRVSARAAPCALLGLALFAAVLWKAMPPSFHAMAFAAGALATAVSLRLLKLPEFALPGQTMLAAVVWFFPGRYFDELGFLWWEALLLVATPIALVHWWQRQRMMPLAEPARSGLQLGGAIAAAACGTLWLTHFPASDAGLVVTSGIALGSLLYGVATRAWSIAAVGQWFTLLSVRAFFVGLIFDRPAWYLALAPIANLALTAALLTHAASGRMPALRHGATFAGVAAGYRIATSGLFALWGWEYVEERWRITFFAGLGAAQIFAGCLLRNRERIALGSVYAVAGLVLFWMRFSDSATWENLAAILAVPASLRLGRRLAGDTFLPSEVRQALVIAALASLWLWVTRYTLAHGNTGQLTPAWALLALVVFAARLLLRERVYRLGGFAILALALGRIFLVDVWKLETLYRIASFLILGAVLLLLGFIYNRFAETLRRWL